MGLSEKPGMDSVVEEEEHHALCCGSALLRREGSWILQNDLIHVVVS